MNCICKSLKLMPYPIYPSVLKKMDYVDHFLFQFPHFACLFPLTQCLSVISSAGGLPVSETGISTSVNIETKYFTAPLTYTDLAAERMSRTFTKTHFSLLNENWLYNRGSCPKLNNSYVMKIQNYTLRIAYLFISHNHHIFGENYIMKSLMICTPHPILFG